jgi:hypothetical protein
VDVVGVGAPLFNRDGQLVGGMGLSGPAYRLGRQPQAALSEPLMKAAATLQSALARSSVPGVSLRTWTGRTPYDHPKQDSEGITSWLPLDGYASSSSGKYTPARWPG